MTPTRYYLAQFGQAFGYFRKSQRMGDAASEMHLLREAEAVLGEAIWQNVEHIDELSVEYWNLRKLMKEHEAVRRRLDECQSQLDKAHEQRSQLLNSLPEDDQELVAERMQILGHLEELAAKRDNIINRAREVRRAYVGLKTKLEVLTNEAQNPDPADITGVKKRLMELKRDFTNLKQERSEIGQLIEEGDAKIDVVDAKLGEKRSIRRAMASEAFQSIGEGNKELSTLKAESGLLDTRMRQLFGEIGRYVSRYANQNQACAEAAKSHRGMVDVMRALRRSIALNHRLAGTA